jgi:hypothetical protein
MHVLLWGLPLFSAAVSIPRLRSDYYTSGFEISEKQDRSERTDEQRFEVDANNDALTLRRAAVIVRQCGAATCAHNFEDRRTVSYGGMLCGNESISEEIPLALGLTCSAPLRHSFNHLLLAAN